MDSIQSYKDFEKASPLQGVGQIAQHRSVEAQVNIVGAKLSITGALFFIYRKGLKPFLHAFGFCGCRFVPSCSCYAEHLFQRTWSIRNFFKVVGRISRCNAWTTPILTFDPPTPDYLFAQEKL